MSEQGTPRTENPFTAIAQKLIEGDKPKQVSEEAPASSVPAEEAEAPQGGEAAPQETEATGEQGDGEQQESTARLIPVPVDGEIKMLPEAELVAGYQRKEDYGRKIREAADTKRQAEAAKAEVTQLHQTLATELGAVRQMYQSFAPTPEAMNAALQRGDTAEYLRMQQQVNALNAMAQRQTQLTQAQQQQQEQEYQARLATEQTALTAKLPEYAKPEAHAKLKEYLTNQGWTPEEVGTIADHRAILAAHKAMLWDELQAKKPDVQKRVDNLPKLAKPGARQDKGAVDSAKVGQAMEALHKTGKFASDADRVAVFGRFVGIN